MSGLLGIKSKECGQSGRLVISKAAKAVLLTGVAGFVLTGCVGDLASGNKRPSNDVKLSNSSNSQSDSEDIQIAGLDRHVSNETKFSSKEFGVKGSPRITTVKRPRKGGGRYQIGKPYKIKGRWYKPKLDPNLKQVGLASWYGPNFHGRLTANGEIYDQYALTAAHPTMPLPSYAKVTNLENGRKITVRVNDRGPFSKSRVIDLSARAAKLLGYDKQGLAKVRVEYAGKARMDGLDEKVLMASYVGPRGTDIGAPPRNLSGSGTMLAMAETSTQDRPSEAISSAFSSSEIALSAKTIAVPTIRPTIFEGIPLAENEPVTYQLRQTTSGPRPAHSLSYVEGGNSTDAVALEAAIKNIRKIHIAYYGTEPERQTFLTLGRVDKAAQNVLRQLTDDLNGVEIVTSGDISQFLIREEYANTVLERMRAAGLSQAQFQ